MIAIHTGTDVERALDISPRERAKLQATGVLPPVTRAGRVLLYERSAVDRFGPQIGAPVPSLLVRLGTPSEEYMDGERRKIGWHESWTDEEKQEAARKFWAVARPDDLVGAPLIALVAVVVVGVWRIDGYETVSGLRAFDVTAIPDSPLVNKIIKQGRGPNVIANYPDDPK